MIKNLFYLSIILLIFLILNNHLNKKKILTEKFNNMNNNINTNKKINPEDIEKKALEYHNKLINMNKTYNKKQSMTNTDLIKTKTLETIKELDENKILNEYITSLDNSINSLNGKLNSFDMFVKDIKKDDEPMRSIKSFQNGLKLNIHNIDNDKYLVGMNDGCLSVKDTGDYTIEECNKSNSNQLFHLKNIYDDNEYNSNLELGLDNVKESDNIKYPMVLLKSDVNNRCLQNNHNSISVEPCMVKRSQRWNALEKQNICN